MVFSTKLNAKSDISVSKISNHPGMGAIPYAEGTAFRVWAPFATAVYVAGDFNNWSTTANPLASENNGLWSVDVPEAQTGQKYRYVIQSPFIPADVVWWRTDPYCKHVLDNEDASGIIVTDQFDWGSNKFNMPPWNELVIYELHVASFNRTATKPGDFSSIINKLAILKELGINAIELMPIFGFPGEYSLGYNPAFPFDIESNYGDPYQFKNFVKTAHELGIAVILDVVYNHFGSQELDYSLRRLDGWSENNGDGIYFYNDSRVNTGFGPRPDYGRAEVRKYIRDNAMMWLEEYQIDGLRFDSTVNIRNSEGRNNDPAHDIAEGWGLMQSINNEIDRKMPWKLTIAEDLQNNEWINRSTQAGGAGFDSQWGSFFYSAIFDTIKAPNDRDRNMYRIRDAILQRFETDAWKRVIYSENHDEVAQINGKVRLPEAIWPGNANSWFARKRSTLAAALVFTSPGIPMIFQGQEFLEWGSWSDAGTLDWSKKDTFAGIWNLYQSLIRLRRNLNNNTRGLQGQNVNVYHVNNNDKAIAFHRWDKGGAGDDVIVVVNMSNRAYDSYSLGFPRGGMWWVRFNSDWNGYSQDFGNHPGYNTFANSSNPNNSDGMSFRANVGIGPYSVLILSQ